MGEQQTAGVSADAPAPGENMLVSVALANAVGLITSAQLAEILNIPLATIERWRRCGGGPPWIRVGPKAIRYDRIELTKWLERRRPIRVPM